MDYGRAIRVVRTAYGLSQAELAERLSIGASQLSFIESGKRDPSVKVLEEIAGVLQVAPHLMALLASDPEDIEDPRNANQISEMANALLRVLVSGGPQPTLRIGARKEKG